MLAMPIRGKYETTIGESLIHLYIYSKITLSRKPHQSNRRQWCINGYIT